MISTQIQKRFADIDILGHVNNVNLQHYFDVGKGDFFFHVLELPTPAHLGGTGVITASTSTSYIAQTRFNESVHVQTSIEVLGNKSFTLFQRLVNLQSGEVKVESRSVMVAFDFKRQESVILPDDWRAALSEHYL